MAPSARSSVDLEQLASNQYPNLAKCVIIGIWRSNAMPVALRFRKGKAGCDGLTFAVSGARIHPVPELQDTRPGHLK